MSPSDRCEETIIHEEHVRAAQERLVSDLTATHLAELFKALGDPTRVRLLSALRSTGAELCVCDIAATLGMSQSAVSHQLRLLRTLRLVKYRKEGRMVYYSLDDEHVERLLAEGLNHAEHG